MPDILLIEDDPDLREDVTAFLRHSGFAVRDCPTLDEARTAILEAAPQAAIIDVLLPDGSGLSLLPWLREQAPDCVNLVLSARSDIDLKLEAFREGAVSYLVKPVDLRELVGLLGVTLRRQDRIQEGAWILSMDSLSIRGPRGAVCALSLNEVTLLRTLAIAESRFATRSQLIESMGYNPLDYDEQRLEAMISRLRRKLVPLGDNPIKAEHGRGYVFTDSLRLE